MASSTMDKRQRMARVLPWLIWILWVVFVLAVLARYTPLYVNAFLTVAGTALLAKLTARYRAHGWQGLKVRRWSNDAESQPGK